ncbi:transposable element Tcb1 transposase [Trichonephila clavipes]|nr:transposable element Tcb1 transposase [Trichonephila clavipes]
MRGVRYATEMKTLQDALFICYKQSPENVHSVAFSQRSSSLRLIEDETLNDRGVGTSGSKRCHLYEDQAQDALDRPVVEKTATSSDDNRVRVWGARVERRNPALALRRHTTSTAGVMVWGAIACNTRTPLVLTCGIMTAKRACMGSFGMVSWASHEFERTRGKFITNMERNVSKHHTELACLNARSYRIVHSR